jgi:hypothetical protein
VEFTPCAASTGRGCYSPSRISSRGDSADRHPSGSSHTLTTAITVDANSSLAVTFTNDSTMGLSTPAACQNTYFQMPSLTGVTATGGAATPSTGPLTDSWTS